MQRRHFIARTGQAGLALSLPVLTSEVFGQSGPIKIGFMAPLTGVAAAPGREMVDGWNLFWQQHGMTIAGRPVEILTEDDGSNPDTALQKARRLHQQQGVHMLVGNVLANTGRFPLPGAGAPGHAPPVEYRLKQVPNLYL